MCNAAKQTVMASRPENEIDKDFLQCPLCSNWFDTEDHECCLLPCLHAVCSVCLNQDNTKKLTACPVCSEPFPEDAQTSFPVDRTRPLLQDFWKLHKENTISCSECSNGASSRCMQCPDYLCDSCSERHRKMKLTAKHTLKDLQSVKDLSPQAFLGPMNCDKEGHEQYPLDTFCAAENCEVPVCYRCVATEHNGHQVKPLDDVFRPRDESVRNIITDLKSRQMELSGLIPKLTADKEALETTQQPLCQKIDDFFDSLQALVEKQRQGMKSKLSRAADRKSQGLKSQLQRSESAVQQLETTTSICQKLSSCSLPASFLQVFPMVQERLSDLTDQLGDVRRHENSVLDVQRSDDALQRFEEVLQSLATIVSSEAIPVNTDVEVNRRVTVGCSGVIARIQLRNENMGAVCESKADVRVVVKGSDEGDLQLDCPRYDERDGCYEVVGTCPTLGPHRLFVFVDEQAVKTEGFEFVVNSPGNRPTSNSKLSIERQNSVNELQNNLTDQEEEKSRRLNLPKLSMLRDSLNQDSFDRSTDEGSGRFNIEGDQHLLSFSGLSGPAGLVHGGDDGVVSFREPVPHGLQRIYCAQPVKDHVTKHLRERGLTVTWESSDSGLVLSGQCQKDISCCLSMIRENVVKRSLRVRPEESFLMESDKWQTVRGGINTDFENKVFMEYKHDDQTLEIHTTLDIAEDVINRISTFFRDNAVLELRLSYSQTISDAIKQQHDEHFSTICKSFSQYYVRIEFDHTDRCFVVRGIGSAVGRAAFCLDQEAANLKSNKNQTNKTKDRLESSAHAETKDGEKSSKTRSGSRDRLVDGTGRFLPTVNVGGAGCSVGAVSLVGDDRIVLVTDADLTTLPVEVIVNAADVRLYHDGGLALAIVRKGGNVIQTECTDYIKTHGLLKEGDTFCSTGGKLPCRHVVHAVSPVWKGGESGERTRLYNAVQNSLDLATERGAHSIAIPALSAGTHRYPVKLVTRCITEAVSEYFNSKRTSSLRMVYLCDRNAATVKTFTESCVSVFGDDSSIVCSF